MLDKMLSAARLRLVCLNEKAGPLLVGACVESGSLGTLPGALSGCVGTCSWMTTIFARSLLATPGCRACSAWVLLLWQQVQVQSPFLLAQNHRSTPEVNSWAGIDLSYTARSLGA